MEKSFRIWLTNKKKFIYHFHKDNWSDKKFKKQEITFNPNYSLMMPALGIKDCQDKMIFAEDNIEYFHPEHCRKILGFGSYLGCSPEKFRELGIIRISPKNHSALKRKHPNLIIQKAKNHKYNIYFIPLDDTIHLHELQYYPRSNDKSVLDICSSQKVENKTIYPAPYIKVTGNDYEKYHAHGKKKFHSTWVALTMGIIGMVAFSSMKYFFNYERKIIELKKTIRTEPDAKKRKELRFKIREYRQKIKDRKAVEKAEKYKECEIERLRKLANSKINNS